MLRSKFFLALLAVAILFAVYRNYTFFRQRTRAMTPVAMASPLMSETRGSGALENEEEKGLARLSSADRLRFAGGLGRDPFVLAGDETSATVPKGEDEANRLPRLNAVLWSSGRRVALLNGEVHREGEQIYGRKILRIEPERVILAGGGDGVMIELKKGTTP